MKFKVYKISLIIPLIFIAIGLFIGYCIFNKKDSLPNQWTITDNSNSSSIKFTNTKSLIKEIKSVKKIVPLEIELSDEILINDSWGNLEVFQKIKKINFYANCSYYVDLSELSSDSININDNSIELSIPKPKILSIDILTNKTIYNEPDLGLLRFGDIKLSTEDYGLIYKNVIDVFSEKMLSEDLYSKALEESELSIKKILYELIGSNKHITIHFL